MSKTESAIRKTIHGKYEVTSITLNDGAGQYFHPKFKTLKAARAFVTRTPEAQK